MANNPNQPRLRVNRTTSLSVTPTWQKIVFNGTSNFNVNTFGLSPGNSKRMVEWDSTNELFRFYDPLDQNYLMFINAMTTTTLITTRASLQYRCVIPNGGGSNVNTYFPFPEEGGMIDAGEITLIATTPLRLAMPFPLYLESTIRANGFWIEIRISNALVALGVCNLNNCTVLIQSTK